MLCKEITKEAVERWQLVLLSEPLPFLVFDLVHGSVCTSGLREGSGIGSGTGSGEDLGDLSELPNISPALW